MHLLRTRSWAWAIAVLMLLPAAGFAAGAGDASPIVFVADSRASTGWRAWCTNLYNENLLGFTILTIVVIPVVALVLGSVTNYLLSLTGLDLKSRVLAEH